MAEITQALKDEYAAFAASELEQFRVGIRRERATELRELLANPDQMTLEIFNHEVWRVNEYFALDGQRFPIRELFDKPLSPERLSELSKALTAGELELHGNCLWGSGARIFGAPLQVDDAQKLVLIREALAVLNGSGTPLEKAKGIETVNGFGPNIATGLVMVYHPTEFQIYNEPSRAAVRDVGFAESPLSAFEESVAEIRAALGAEDFIELDWFMYTRARNTLSLTDLTSREAVEAALAEFDDLGREAFLEKYGFGAADRYFLRWNDRDYDAKAIAGAAVGHEHPERGPLPAGAFSGGEAGANAKLRELGFEVMSKAQPTDGVAHDVHLVVKWTPRFNAETDLRHLAVAQQQGAVWWGLLSKSDEPRISAQRQAQLRQQLDAGRDVHAFIVGQFGGSKCWRTRLLDFTVGRSNVDPELVPSYYNSDWKFHLWLKLTEFEEIDRDELYRLLDPDTSPGQPIALSNQSNPLFVRLRTTPRYWWVNQGASFSRARQGRFLWAPVLDKAGRTKDHWRTMGYLRPGDIVFNYANGQIRATSVVLGHATPASRPDPEADQAWSDEGLRVELNWRDLTEPVKLSDIPTDWRKNERVFAGDGSVNQGYLFPLSDAYVSKLAGRFPQLLDGDAPPLIKPNETGWVEPLFDEIVESVASAGMTLNARLLRRYHVSLKTRGFVVLSGVSGTGKTWLAQAYADAVQAQAIVVPVAPNWTTNEDLLGYLNPLTERYYDTAFSLFLREAATEFAEATTAGRRAAPYHLILDEMNLARVEYYFAKFLSAMELRARSSDATIELAPGNSVLLPPNLKFIGTVNVDETTHGFADKVYDRSQLIEMTIDRPAVEAHLEGRPYAGFVGAVWATLCDVAPFAFRVLDEITTYVDESARLNVGWEEALDEQLLQKVLPKIKGTDLRLGPALRTFTELSADTYPLSHEKATSMLAAFNEHGFTSYF
jgi:hypothetical protein